MKSPLTRSAGVALLLLALPLGAHAISDSYYIGPDQGNWDTSANWSAGGPFSNINALNISANTVVHSSTGNSSVANLSFTGTGGFSLTGGSLTGSLTNGASQLSVAGTFTIGAAELADFTVAHSDAIVFSNPDPYTSQSTLWNIAIDGGLNLADNASVAVEGNFSHGNGASFNLGGDTNLSFNDNYTLDNASLNALSATRNSYVTCGGTLTLGPNLAVSGQNLVLANGSGTIVNNTSLVSKLGATWVLAPTLLTNSAGGVIEADGAIHGSSILIVARNMSNQGTIKAVNGGWVTFTSPLLYGPLGTVIADGAGSTIELVTGYASYPTTAELSGVTATNGGVISVETRLANGSATLNAAPTPTGAYQLHNGGIYGGSVTNSNSLIFKGTSNTLSAVAIDHGLTIADGAQVTFSGTHGAGATFNLGAGSVLAVKGDFAQDSGGALAIAYTASSDPNATVGNGLVTISGAATVGGDLAISFEGPGTASPGENGASFDFLTYGTLANTDFGSLFSNEYAQGGNYYVNGIDADSVGGSPAVYQLTQNGNRLHLTLQTLAAPEPSELAALGLGVLGLSGLAFRARKRRARTT